MQCPLELARSVRGPPMPCARGDNSPEYLDSRDKRSRIGRLMTRMTRTIGSAEKLIAPSRSVIPMATLTWRCEAKPRFLQMHVDDSSYSLCSTTT